MPPPHDRKSGVNVCFLNHDMKATSGAGRFGRGLIERLAKANPAMRLAILVSVASAHPGERAIVPESGIGLLAALPRIRRIFRDADVIHALDGYPYGLVAALAAWRLNKPLIITAIGTGAVQPLYHWYAPFVRWAYRRADCMVAISHHTREEILRCMPDLEMSVINHAVDAEEFSGDSTAALTSDERRILERWRPYVLSVGSWKPRKGFAYSFQAFAELKRRHPDLRYIVCGIGPKPHLTEPLGITESVLAVKGIRWEFLKALYTNAEAFFLLPVDDKKDIEGFGFAFLEAAAAGVPVVASRGSGAEDAVAEGENALLVPPRDAHAAAQALDAILGDTKLKARLAAGSRRFAQRMRWDDVAARYRALYRSVRKGGAESIQ